MCVFECFGSFYNVIAEQRKQRKGVSMYWGVGQERQRVQEGKLDKRERKKGDRQKKLWRGVKRRGVKSRGVEEGRDRNEYLLILKREIYIERNIMISGYYFLWVQG